ncbi:MAG: hypothetical protein ACRDYF_12505 [Acidimicrobiia bacterium]
MSAGGPVSSQHSRFVPDGVGRVGADGLVEAAVDVAARVVGEVLADVDDHRHLGLREGEQQSPRSPEMDDAEPVDAFACEAVPGGVAPDLLQGLDRRHERWLDRASKASGGLAAERRPADSKAMGVVQRSALETSW